MTITNTPVAMPVPKPKPDRSRIAIVDDHEMVRAMLATLCTDWPHGDVVMMACDGVDYEEQLPAVGPVDIAIVDLSMPRRDGYLTIAWIKERQPDVSVMALSHDMHDAAAHGALHAGANALMEKSMAAHQFHDALEALRTTGVYGNDRMLRTLTYRPDPNTPSELRKKLGKTLSDRETEFMLHYIDDASPSRMAIARAMSISANTAETHRKHIVEKTGCHTRLAMLKLAIRFGLVHV